MSRKTAKHHIEITRTLKIMEGKLGRLKALKLDKKYSGLLVAFFMTLVLDTTMTFTMTSINTGWTTDFLQRFLQSWIIGFIVAFPTSILAIPLARRIATSLVSEQK